AITKVYGEHLKQLLGNLQQKNSGLAEAFAKVVMATEPVEFDGEQPFKLQSLGLIHVQGNQVIPSCQLYAQYFRTYFRGNI
ncbi:MAG: AAA-like domain-containing protein, partial [Microcystaceae cyanobacterium]